jgi:hypothetical protein
MSSWDEFETLVLREIGVVLDVDRGEWQLTDGQQAPI